MDKDIKKSDKKIICIIPARMESSRFPGKPLAKILEMPMIGHCYLRSRMCNMFDEVYVATCNTEIFDYIESIGGKAVMTANTHERATDRTAEAVQIIEKMTDSSFDIVVMVQGDEPMVDPKVLEDATNQMLVNNIPPILNIITKITDLKTFENPNTVKLVTSVNGNMLYLSRSAIPSKAKYDGDIPMLKQLGIILFSKEFLFRFNEMIQTPLEIIESCDMNRVIENDIPIPTFFTEVPTWAIDTPEDLEFVEKKMMHDSLIELYAK